MTTHQQNKDLNLVADVVSFEAAPSDEKATSLRRFTMTAYTGGPMNLNGWRYPVVVDFQGMQMRNGTGTQHFDAPRRRYSETPMLAIIDIRNRVA